MNGETLNALAQSHRWAGTHSMDDPYNQHLPWRLFFSTAWQSTAVQMALPTQARTAGEAVDPVL